VTAAVLRLTGVSKRFGGVQALRGVDFVVQPGTVHCLIGENGSGKSTLIKIATGVFAPDAGRIDVDGHAHAAITPLQAIRYGIEVIHQDLSLFPNLTVAENIAIAPYLAQGRRLFRHREARAIASHVIRQVGVALDVDAAVEDLSVADRQLTAICRALAQDARVIIMDEPTAALTWREVDALFAAVRQLAARGVAVVFISHKLDEVLEIADHITVLRNGAVVADGPARRFDRVALIRSMTGREIVHRRGEWTVAPDAPVVLDVARLSAPGAFEDVSFTLRRGEIVGLAGLLGSGTADVVEALFGIVPTSRGQIRIGGRARKIRMPADAIAAGVGYVPNDRLREGLFLRHPISWNIVAARVDAVTTPLGFLRWGMITAAAQRVMADLHIAAPSPATVVGYLSGGNQQRVVLGKWLWTHPALLLLNGPTVGVDVGSKEDIHALLRSLSERGTAAVVASDDVPELVAVCHRILMMRRGRVAMELAGAQVTEEAVLRQLHA
jgi:simple sugar transport system ATP-binding protein